MNIKTLLTTIVIVFFCSCSTSKVGSKKRPFTMYYVPSVDAQTISNEAEKISQFVQKSVSQKLYGKDEGFYVQTAVPTSYIAVVESFGTKRADFAALTTFSYVLAKDIKKYPVRAFLATIRGHGEKTYKAQILAKKGSGIKSLKDLKGKKFAYTDPASTSGYIMPAKLFKDQGIELGEVVYAQKHENVITMIMQGQVDAGATYYNPPEVVVGADGKEKKELRDARARVLTQYPNIENELDIIGFTDDVPNEPWVIRDGLFKDPAMDEKVRNAVAEALIAYVGTPDGLKSLKSLYTVTGFERADDDMYREIRDTILKTNIDLEKTLK